MRYIAQLARIALDPEEIDLFQQQLEDILGYVHQLNEVNVEGIEPTQHSVPVENVMRDDEPEVCDVHESAMKNAPAAHQGQFVVPRIVE